MEQHPCTFARRPNKTVVFLRNRHLCYRWTDTVHLCIWSNPDEIEKCTAFLPAPKACKKEDDR